MKLLIFSLLQVYTVVSEFTLSPCSSKIDEIVAGLSTNETHYWDLKSLFSGSYLTYNLSTDQYNFFIQSPIYQYSNPIPLLESVTKVNGIAALKESTQRVWLNHFAFIAKSIGITKVYYAENAQGSYSSPPNFNKAIQISSDNSVTCPGIEYLQKDIFILDCYSNSQTYLSNTFRIVNKNGTILSYNNQNYNNYQVNSRRINQIVTLTKKTGGTYKLLFRSTPAYATEKTFDIASILEVFSFNDSFVPTRVMVLTGYDFAVLIGYPSPFQYDFSLIDFEVSSTGLVYILTAYQGLFIFQMNETYDLTYIKQLSPTTAQAYEFDVDWIFRADGSINEIIAILYSKQVYIYRERVLINQYDLDLVASYPAYISITQEFIITQIKGVTQVFNTETQDAIFKQSIEGLTAFLINPFYTEMIAITQVDSRRYQITNGKLKFQQTLTTTSTKKQMNITATDVQNNQCQVSLVYKITDFTDPSVQSLRELPINTLEYDFPPSRIFVEPASGPNIQYQNYASEFDITISQGQTIPLQILSQNTAFLQMLSLSADDTNVAIINQDINKYIKTEVCKITYSSENPPMICRSYASYYDSVFLNENNFAWFDSPTAFYSVRISSDQYFAQFYQITVKDVTLPRYIQYQSDTLNKINSVTILAGNVYLTLNNKKVIDVWTFSNATKIQSITETSMKSLGMAGNWSPVKTYGNHIHHASLLFIVNEDNVVVIDYHKEVTLIKEIYLGKGEIAVSIGKTTFAVIYKGENTQSIQEFDLNHLGFISLIKQLPLYLYTLSSPLKTVQSLGSGSFYVIAYDIKETQGNVILSYQLENTLRDSLYKVQYYTNITSTSQIILSATGTDHEILYYRTNISGSTQHQLQVIYNDYYYQILPQYKNSDQISYNGIMKVIAFNNIKKDLPIVYSKTITLINTMTQLYVNQSLLNSKSLNVNRSQQDINFGHDWVSGFTGSHILDCGQCGEKIQMFGVLEETSVWDDPTLNIIHSGPFTYSDDIHNPTYQILLSSTTSNNQILIIDNNGTVVKRISLSTSQNFVYDKLLTPKQQYDSQLNILLSGYNSSDGFRYVQTIQCKSIATCGSISFWTQLNQTRYIREFQKWGNFLYVLDAHPTDPLAYQGQVHIYLFWIYDTSVTSAYRHTKTIEGQNVVSFVVGDTWLSSSYYSQLQLISAQGYLQNNIGTYPSSGTIHTWRQADALVKLSSEMQKQSFVGVENFVDLIATQKQTYNAGFLEWQFVIIGDLAHTCLTLTYNYANLNIITLSSIKINYQLTAHQQAKAIHGAKKLNNSYVVPYTDGKNIIISYYSVEVNKNVIPSFGGIVESYNYQKRHQVVCVLFRNDLIFTNIKLSKDGTYYLNTVYRSLNAFTFRINNQAGEIYSQELTLKLYNELGEATAKINLVSTTGEKEDEIHNESKTFLSKMSEFVWELF